MQCIDDRGNIFQAQRFRKTGNGAVMFGDGCLGKRTLDFEWEEFWEDMVKGV